MFKGLKKLVLLSFLLVFVVSMVHTAHASEVYSGGEVIVSPMTYDFGDVYPEKGLVSTTFTVENVGSEVLKINKLSTSCGVRLQKWIYPTCLLFPKEKWWLLLTRMLMRMTRERL